MRCLCLFAIAALAVSSSSCTRDISATASYNPGYGPFDRDGNYVEAWADEPARQRAWADDPKPAVEPVGPLTPPVAAPPILVSTHGRQTIPNGSLMQPRRSLQSRPVAPTQPVLSRPSRPTPPPVASNSHVPRPAPTRVAPTRPKPPIVRPSPPKPMHSTRSHTVAKGDTLYSLSRRYGTTVEAIQRANGLNGTLIRLGDSIKIP